MSIKIYAKGSHYKLSDNFVSGEFDCKCSNASCYRTYIEDDLVSNLELLRAELNLPITINSGYRCIEYQKQLANSGIETASGISTHTVGTAVDIYTGHSGFELEDAARDVGFLAVGVADNWAHLDTRNDKERRWFYSKRKKDV